MAQLKNTTIDDTRFLQLPSGTTAQQPGKPGQPAADAGQIRFNSTLGLVEWYDAEYSSWFPAGFIPPIATGGTVTDITQGGVDYRVHTFTSVGSSTFTVTRSGPVEFLIVAGGGSGGGGIGAGGGAGGALIGSTSVTPRTYTITVGAGGLPILGGSSQTGLSGNPGGLSGAFGLTAIGGGAGGRHRESDNAGKPGGSGGGAGNNGDRIGGAGTPGQGNAGGNASGGSPNWSTGGGGGASSPGESVAGSDVQGGAGGTGIFSNIDGNLYWYAGGGGGGVHNGAAGAGNGGIGGGGGGSASGGSFGLGGIGRNPGQNGQSGGGTDGGNGGDNTGGGGGGGAWDQTFGGSGGSGIVIIRYRIS